MQNLTLFDAPQTKPENATGNLPPNEAPEAMPPEIVYYASLWQRYRTAAAAFVQAVEELQKDEQAFLGESEEKRWSSKLPDHQHKELTDFHGNLVNTLCWRAEAEFAAPGSKLSVDREEVKELPVAQIESFDLVALWRFLKRKYDSDTGKEASYRLAAMELRHAQELSPFNRNQQSTEAKTVGGRFVLTINIYGDWSYSYTTKETLAKFILALKCVAVWANIWQTEDEEAIDSLLYRIRENRANDPRPLGRMEQWRLLTVQAYKQKFDFRLVPTLAEQIQVFLQTYAQPQD